MREFSIDVDGPERYNPGGRNGIMRTWLVPILSAIGAVLGSRFARGLTGVALGAAAGVATGLAAGWALDRLAPGAGTTAPTLSDRVEP